MKISLNQISKRFQRHWIFKDISYDFFAPGSYALLGPNGCGKSTLLRIIAGMQSPSKGKIKYYINDEKLIPTDEIFNQVSFCAPGQELVEELTLNEFFNFHFSFKHPLPGLTINKIIELTGLTNATDKPIGDYSSGMRQRVKLAQAIFSDTSTLLLDEPCTNLDQQGVEQYRTWMEEYTKNRLIIIASNDVREYYLCREQIILEEYR
jgi:ABC-type multidrug transport system ATPase subunit